MKLSFSDEAKVELQSIVDWIAKDDPVKAFAYLKELHESCAKILDFPESFPVVSRYGTSNIRRKVHGPYLIFYVVEEQAIKITHVIHGSRDYEELLFPKA